MAGGNLHEVLADALLRMLQDDVLVESFERHFGLLPCVESSSEDNAAAPARPGGYQRAGRLAAENTVLREETEGLV